MSTPIILNNSYRQLPTICEPMDDGTGRLRCVPVEEPWPVWLTVGLSVGLLILLGWVVWMVFDTWRWVWTLR